MTAPANVSVIITRDSRETNVRSQSVRAGRRTAWDMAPVTWPLRSVPVICTGQEQPVTHLTAQGLPTVMGFQPAVMSHRRGETPAA